MRNTTAGDFHMAFLKCVNVCRLYWCILYLWRRVVSRRTMSTL